MKELAVQPSPDKGAVVDLAEIREVGGFVGAFETLIERSSEFRGEQGRKADKFPDSLRRPFQESEFGDIHEALFGLARKFDYVWVQGGKNYGLRVAHKDYKSSVLAWSPVSTRVGSRLVRHDSREASAAKAKPPPAPESKLAAPAFVTANAPAGRPRTSASLIDVPSSSVAAVSPADVMFGAP